MQCTTGRFRDLAGPATMPSRVVDAVTLLYVGNPC